MTRDEFNAFCGSLPAAAHVQQWHGSQVWKVGGKVFAFGNWRDAGPAITFKVSDLSYEILRDMPGLRPAPYLASRGLKWIQHYAEPGLPDDELHDYLRAAHMLVASKLPKKVRHELDVAQPEAARADRTGG